MRILIAEDERITRASLARQLQSWGHTVTAAEDGAGAWQLFRSAEFDLVLTDWEMPGLSGLELIQHIRAAGASFVYIIMLTGRSEKADLVKGIEAGADDFLSKPFDREELRVRLLAGERIVKLERTLNRQNAELREASERMHSDLRAAARVQRAILPRSDIETPLVRTAWTYVPSDMLAGDAIGLELLDDRYLAAYVIDVSGHGVPAALLSVTAMHALGPGGGSAGGGADAIGGASLLRGGAADAHSFAPPARVVRELNRRFCASDNDGRFLTMILCVLDTVDGVLRFARAGHPLPVILRAGKSIPLDDAGGVPIGMVDSAEYDEVSVTLSPGDRLVLLTDGFIEQYDRTGNELFGLPRVEEALSRHAAAPGHLLVEEMVSELESWAGTRHFTDDATLVVIDWTGPQ